MSSASPISTQSVGRTFAIAISALGIVALVQVSAVGWVFAHRFQSLAAKAIAPMQKGAPSRAVASARNTGEDEEKITPEDPFAEQADATKTADSTDPILPPAKPEPVPQSKLNPPPGPPQNRFQELMQQGRALKQRGDMNTALTRFREAAALDAASPGNVEAIAEIAMTYERMSLLDKAAEQWKRIYDMGDAAGTYYIAAESRLKMTQAQAQAQALQSNPPQDETPISSLRADATLGLGEIARVDRADDSAALKFALRVPIKAKRGVKINVQDVDILVLFYDQLDAKTIVQTSADVSYHFTSQPIDWAGGEPETLEVEYKQATLVPDVKKGPHKYHGYIVRVYYKGDLQDTHSEPETLNAKFPAPQTLDTIANQK